MGRSWRLVEGRWWRTFFTLLLMFVIWFVARTALRAFIVLAQSLLQLVIPTVAALWIAAASSVIVGSLVNPLLQIAIVLIYFDLRVRREALDLFQLAQRVSSPQPAQ
jgi:Mn2+/Fe2+ NRAMP family transporter